MCEWVSEWQGHLLSCPGQLKRQISQQKQTNLSKTKPSKTKPSIALCWPNTTNYQPVLTYTDPIPSCIDQYRLQLAQCDQVPTTAAFYWPCTIINQPVRFILTQYHQVWSSTNLYCCCLRIRDFCTVYPGSCLRCWWTIGIFRPLKYTEVLSN